MSSDLSVLHVDNHLLVVDKPAGLASVPDSSGEGSLLELAKEWIGREYQKPGAVFLGVVQRLDRPVSGVLAFARTSKAAARLSEQMRSQRITKTYLGVVQGQPSAASGEVRQWLVKDAQRNRVRVRSEPEPGAREALTRWRVLASEGGVTLLALEPLTGRPHQLRVALASLGHPLLGDVKYGADAPLPDRSLALHALRLGLEHPTRRGRLAFEAQPPPAPWWDAFRARFPARP